jgi:hypothetical protein
MKKYVAIGHFKESDNATCVAVECSSIKSMKANCIGNGFVAWVIISEKKLNALRELDAYDLFEAVEKMTSNYRKWNDITDYLYQCMDIIDERIARA